MINVKGSFPVTLAPEKERQTVLRREKKKKKALCLRDI